jgi:hypothetical protein
VNNSFSTVISGEKISPPPRNATSPGLVAGLVNIDKPDKIAN